MTPLVIIGAGGFGRECHDIVVAMNEQRPQWDFLGFIDDAEPDPDLLARRGTKWIGTTDCLTDHAGASFVVAVGDPAIRRSLAAGTEAVGLTPGTLVHPSSTQGLDVRVGEGSVICSHTSVTTNVAIGRHVHVDQNAAVAHDSTLSDFTRVSPGATISGNVYLGEGVTIGTNAAVIQGVRIGADAFVGAGAVVLTEVEPGATVAGVPARPISSRHSGK